MSGIPVIDERDIRALVGAGAFQRGQDYFGGGAIYDPRRQGRTLKAHCEGSYDNAYRVEAEFDDAGISGTRCSCPVGASCKHVAALLLTWLDSPDDFAALEDLDAALQRRGKDELIVLIKQMLRQAPDLDALLHTPLPGAGAVTPDGRPSTPRCTAARPKRLSARPARAVGAATSTMMTAGSTRAR